MKFLNIVFLRLYAVNLARRARNSPDAACNDALMQMGIVLVVPVAAILVLVAACVPFIAAAVSHRAAPFIIAAIIVVIPIIYWVRSRFGHYRSTPQAARAFSSIRERLKSILLFVLFPIVVALVAGFIGYLVKSRIAAP